MAGFMPYMTIRDCLDSCNAEYLDIVGKLVVKYGIQKERYSGVCIGELLSKEEFVSEATSANPINAFV